MKLEFWLELKNYVTVDEAKEYGEYLKNRIYDLLEDEITWLESGLEFPEDVQSQRCFANAVTNITYEVK